MKERGNMKHLFVRKSAVVGVVFLFVTTILISSSTGILPDNQEEFLNYQVAEHEPVLDDQFFDKTISFLMKLARYPSLSACIINDDEVIWSKGYGCYDLETNKASTEHTIYNIGSISKTITGTALMQLYEQGLFDLDEDVNDYLPFNLRNPHFPDDSITFRMLLSHTSSLDFDGIDYFWLNFSADPPFEGYPYPWLKEHLLTGGKWYYPERWSKTYRPGDYALYANVNFDLIAYLVDLISGESFLEYCQDHIFSPLKMYNTSFNLSERDIENVAIPYHFHNGEYLQINELVYMLDNITPPDKYWRMHFYPVGGLYTTVSDLSHFLIAHMNEGVYNGVRILKKETVEQMHHAQPGNQINYGLAWGNMGSSWLNITYSGHNGAIFGVFTWMYFTPLENIGVIYFTNGDPYWEKNPIIGDIAHQMIFNALFMKGGKII